MDILVITSSHKSENEPVLVTKMFEAGLITLHLRKPKFSTKQLSEYIEQIPEEFHNRIIIHSHHNLVFKYDLKGVHFTSIHLNRKFKKWWFLRKLRISGKKILKTRAYRKLSEVYKKEEIAFDYYLLGTIFNTLNNELYSGYYDAGLKAAIKNSGKIFIARGGVNAVTIGKAKTIGFKGAALSSMVWKADQPFEKFIEAMNCAENDGVAQSA
jgi:thiamine-phosphate pyrophosphorylase